VAFSVFDGDLKAGGDGPCSDSLYTTAIANFNTLERPLVWLPGDNDWTDCWGRYGPSTLPFSDSLERLAFEREQFTATDQSLGQKTLTLMRESSEGGAYAAYSENVRWRLGPVVYIGLNVQGSNDNYPYAGVDGETRSAADINRQRAEEVTRKTANILEQPRPASHERRDEDDDHNEPCLGGIKAAEGFDRELRQCDAARARDPDAHERDHRHHLQREDGRKEPELDPKETVPPVEARLLSAKEHPRKS
jgi:hypothetical protein